MNINVPGFVEAALPKGKGGRNVGIIANNMNGPNHNDPGFLSDDFPKTPPRLYITAEDDEFDTEAINEWKEEGFNVEYIPMGAGGKAYKMKLNGLRRVGLGPCETFGIVAYGEAASVCLEHFHIMDNNPDFKLSVLVAYYPTRIPDPRHRFPGNVQVLLHLAGDSVGVVKQSQMVGIQGKKRVGRRRLDRGVGPGGTLRMAFSAFAYDGLDPGFAERDLDEYDAVAAELAWDRSIAAVRRAFRWEGNVMGVVEENAHSKYYAKDEDRLMRTYSTTHTPHVTFMPTLVGGIGADEIARFYGDFFMVGNPPSLELTLVSRTSSAARVVDELHVGFDHTQGVPWMLPGIPPTGRHVEVLVVSIVALRAGKIVHEHVYWDQASVLYQVGLLNPERMVPRRLRDRGVERLPIVGELPARRVIEGGYDDGEGEADNELLPEFFDDDNEDDSYDEEGDYEDDEEYDEEEEEEEEEEGANDAEDGVQDADEEDAVDGDTDGEVDEQVDNEVYDEQDGEDYGEEGYEDEGDEQDDYEDDGAVNGHADKGEPVAKTIAAAKEELGTAEKGKQPQKSEKRPEMKGSSRKAPNPRPKSGPKSAANQASVEDTEDAGVD